MIFAPRPPLFFSYFNYLKELKAQKAIDDCQVDALADADVARAQKIREDEWEKERQKKCRMMQASICRESRDGLAEEMQNDEG